MNTLKPFTFALITILLPHAVLASSFQKSATQNNSLLRSIKKLTLECVVQPCRVISSGERICGELKSVCSELQPDRPGRAKLLMNGTTLHAFIMESEDSDGGDLNHLIIVNRKAAVVAERRNVLAFDNIYMALAGGNSEFIQVYEN